MDDSLAFAGIQELASLLKKREISAVELAQYYLERIDRLNPQLNAFIAVTADRALASAQAAEEAIAGGNYLGPLQGIPIAVKDLVDVAGMPTTGGSVVLKDNVPARDAFVTRRLAQAGTSPHRRIASSILPATGRTTGTPCVGATLNLASNSAAASPRSGNSYSMAFLGSVNVYRPHMAPT